jgi:hypothetical protein
MWSAGASVATAANVDELFEVSWRSSLSERSTRKADLVRAFKDPSIIAAGSFAMSDLTAACHS